MSRSNDQTSYRNLKGIVNYQHQTLTTTKVIYDYLKGALDNILKFSFWLNLIYHVESDC